MLFGSDVYPLALFPNDAWFLFDETFDGGILVSKIDVWGGGDRSSRAGRRAQRCCSSNGPKPAVRSRAVADDHAAAAQSVGIPLDWISRFVVWLVAGLVALVAATVWGTKLGVQFSITFLALKGACPFSHHRRVHVGARRHRRRLDHRRRRKARLKAWSRPGRSSAAASNTGLPMYWR